MNIALLGPLAQQAVGRMWISRAGAKFPELFPSHNQYHGWQTCQLCIGLPCQSSPAQSWAPLEFCNLPLGSQSPQKALCSMDSCQIFIFMEGCGIETSYSAILQMLLFIVIIFTLSSIYFLKSFIYKKNIYCTYLHICDFWCSLFLFVVLWFQLASFSSTWET